MHENSLNEISNTHFDVIVIGAGSNGAGIARDASMRGLKVLLLDKGDIGGGTSSSSTRLIHGGLRYLEHGELGLVRESLTEREILLRIAPHLVKPLPILIPIYQGEGRELFTIRVGMIAYDLLSFGKTLPRHRMLSRAETIAQIPGIKSEGLSGAAVYYDAQVEFAERLILENVMAAQDHGASVVTYARVTRLNVLNGVVGEVEFVCEQTSEAHVARAAVVVNAAGPWVDQLLSQSLSGSRQLLGGTKGSHIVVAPFQGAPKTALYVEAEADRRPFFIIPWNRQYLIGTTDIRFTGDLDNVVIETDEVDYLLRETNRVLPQAMLTRDQILYSYSGVRPLPFTDGKQEQSITRRHFIHEHKQVKNLLSIVGGKLTTYRNLAEQCVNLLFRKLGKHSPKCTTAHVPLPGAVEFKAFSEEFLEESRFAPRVNDRLLRIYGTRATEIVQLCARHAEFAQPFNKAGDALTGEIVFSFERELAQTLSDCLLRRTMIGLNSDLGIGDDEIAADIGKRFLGWNEERADREITQYRLSLNNRIKPSTSSLSSEEII